MENSNLEKISKNMKDMAKPEFEKWCYNLYKQTIKLNEKFEKMRLKYIDYNKKTADFVRKEFYPKIILTEKAILNLKDTPDSVSQDIMIFKINLIAYLKMYDSEKIKKYKK